MIIDVPYFLLTQWQPAPVAGFAFGLLHGLAFVLVAIAGMRSAAFLF